MRKDLINSLFVVGLIFGFFIPFEVCLARTDLSISDANITFSSESPIKGDTIRIFARVFNIGDTDVRGWLSLYAGGKNIGDPQAISVKAGDYDDVFIDWTPNAGTYDIKAEITGTSLKEDNGENNIATKKGFLIDSDSDLDGIADSKDNDSDNDGLNNEQENNIGTNPLLKDTDGDGFVDSNDAFPKDASEWKDTDADGLGDNKDLDDDGDEVFDDEEISKYGTNPLNKDTDEDNLNDSKEIKEGTNPNKQDTDADGYNDSKDDYPLDYSKWQASILDSIEHLLKTNDYFLYFFVGTPSLLIAYALLRKKKKRK